MYFTHAEIDLIVSEDLPRQDETSDAIGLPDGGGSLGFRARQPCTVAGLAVCRALGRSLGLELLAHAGDGEQLEAGDEILTLRGSARALHTAWKQALNVLEYCGGIASATRDMVRIAEAVDPRVRIGATRKAFPGARKLQHYAMLCGGGVVHRAGLSETILIFQQHRTFLPGVEVEDLVRRAKTHSPEKFVLVESHDEQDAIRAVDAGCDGVQLDKFSPERLATLARELRSRRPGVVINAAGGIHAGNVGHYAATGVDILVTSSLYTAAPTDIGATMRAD